MRLSQEAGRLVQQASPRSGLAILPVFIVVDSGLELVLDALRQTVVASRDFAQDGQDRRRLRTALGLPREPIGDQAESGYAREDLPFPNVSRRALEAECVVRWLSADIDESILNVERHLSWRSLGISTCHQEAADPVDWRSETTAALDLDGFHEWVADAAVAVREDLHSGTLDPEPDLRAALADLFRSASESIDGEAELLAEFLGGLINSLASEAGEQSTIPRRSSPVEGAVWSVSRTDEAVDALNSLVRVVDWNVPPLWLPNVRNAEQADVAADRGTVVILSAPHSGQRIARHEALTVWGEQRNGRVVRGTAHLQDGVYLLPGLTRDWLDVSRWAVTPFDPDPVMSPTDTDVPRVNEAVDAFTRRRTADVPRDQLTLAERLLLARTAVTASWRVEAVEGLVRVSSTAESILDTRFAQTEADAPWSHVEVLGGSADFWEPGQEVALEVRLVGPPSDLLTRLLFGGDVEMAVRRLGTLTSVDRSSRARGTLPLRRYECATDTSANPEALQAFLLVGDLAGWLDRLRSRRLPLLRRLARFGLLEALSSVPGRVTLPQVSLRSLASEFRRTPLLPLEERFIRTTRVLNDYLLLGNTLSRDSIEAFFPVADDRDSEQLLQRYQVESGQLTAALDIDGRDRIWRIDGGGTGECLSALELVLVGFTDVEEW